MFVLEIEYRHGGFASFCLLFLRAIVEALELMQREVGCILAVRRVTVCVHVTLSQHMAMMSQCSQGSGSVLLSQVGSRAVAMTQGGHR